MSISKELANELLEDDPNIAPFLHDNFDSVQFAAKVAAKPDIVQIAEQAKEATDAWTGGVSAAIEHLSLGVASLERRLHSQITARHDDLLAQASGVEKLEMILDSIQNRISSLSSALERVQARITEPYTKVRNRTEQLTRLQEACDYVRRIIRLLYANNLAKTCIDLVLENFLWFLKFSAFETSSRSS